MQSPTPQNVRSARESAGLTQGAAARLVYVQLRAWQRWESGERSMPAGLWELFGIKAPRPDALSTADLGAEAVAAFERQHAALADPELP